METSAVILLVGSCAVSFGLGRVFVHFRNKRRKKQTQACEAQALREQPPETESRNRSKRKRQLQQLAKKSKKQQL